MLCCNAYFITIKFCPLPMRMSNNKVIHFFLEAYDLGSNFCNICDTLDFKVHCKYRPTINIVFSWLAILKEAISS
jgi:hypothetical protein